MTTVVFTLLYACTPELVEEEVIDHIFVPRSPDSSHIDFVNEVDPYGEVNIINYLYAFNGGGVGIADLNNDGLSDIVLTANQRRNRIYYNKGGWIFEDGTEDSGLLDEAQWSTGVSIIDINNDGHKDIYICNVHDGDLLHGVNRLYINQGNGTFVESAKAYGLDISALSTQAAFFDYDKDNDLDVYLLCHSVHNPANYSKASSRDTKSELGGDRLLENNGSTYIDVSEHAGIYQSGAGYGLGVSTADINQDGWPDIYVSNDFHENDYLYINDQNGRFLESSNLAFSHTSKFSMGCDIADVSGDGYPDIITLDMKPSDEFVYKKSEGPESHQIFELKRSFGYNDQFGRNALQLHSGHFRGDIPIFNEVAAAAGIAATDWSWSVLIEDYNLDSYPDLFITNGIYRRPNDMDYLNYISNDIVQQNENDSTFISKMPSGVFRDFLYTGGPDGLFSDQSSSILSNRPDVSQGAAYGDLDNDGDLDMIINNYNASPEILENRSSGQFVKIDFRHVPSVLSLHAKVQIYTTGGSLYKELLTTRGFQSTVEDIIVFGIPKGATVDSMIIQWNDGSVTRHHDIAINSMIKPTKNISRDVVSELRVSRTIRPKIERYPIDFVHKENEYDDFIDDELLLYKLSDEGPAFAAGDVNGDGLQDYFIGGASGQESALYIATEDGFIKTWSLPEVYEDVAAAFADLDNDGDLDLAVAAGGGQMPEGHAQNTNRIYVNDGTGGFTESYYYIDTKKRNSSCVAISDVDGDGWHDVFFGSKSIIGAYGISPQNRLLRNIRGREYIDIPDSRIDGLSKNGMISDAVWADLDGDQREDLILVGHWMPVTIYWNTGEGLAKEEIQETSGLYNHVSASDINGDGRLDLLLGNVGLNHTLIGDDQELRLTLNDFDRDTILDHIPVYDKGGVEYPVFHKAPLENRFNQLRKTSPTHAQFATTAMAALFPSDIMKRTFVRKIDQFRSFAMLNNGDRKWTIESLPQSLQNYPIYDIVRIGDYYYCAGGDTGFQPLVGSMPSRTIKALDYDDGFRLVEQHDLLAEGNIRHLSPLKDKSGSDQLLVIRNNGKTSALSVHSRD